MDRTGTKTVIVAVKEPKNYKYQDDIFEECLRCLANDDIPVVEYPIDKHLIEYLKRKRKESYSKVCIIVRQMNVML